MKNEVMLKKTLEQIVIAIRSVLPETAYPASLHEPLFRGNEWNYVKECLDTGWVSSVGKFVDDFEKKLAEFTGVKKAVALANGTSALHICLKLVGIEKNDEVIVPALTFVATANAVAYCGAVPHFADSNEKTLGIDPVKLNNYLESISELRQGVCYNKATGRRIKAVVPMHTFGHPVEIDAIIDICKNFKLELVEDAAESLGSYYKGCHTGHWGKVAAVSFNGNKIVTTGGGGAILTNNLEIARLAKHLTTQAKNPHRWEFSHDMVGYNYRLPNINAALGCAQIEQLPGFIKKKRNLAKLYQKAFCNIEGLRFFMEPEFAESNYWLNVIILDRKFSSLRDELLALTHENGILTRPAWKLMYCLPMYENCPRMDCSQAESIVSRLINLPSSVCLG